VSERDTPVGRTCFVRQAGIAYPCSFEIVRPTRRSVLGRLDFESHLNEVKAIIALDRFEPSEFRLAGGCVEGTVSYHTMVG
jgi:hypothetical protein